MKTTIAAVLLATAIASPAFAQSYDPDISGNIAPNASAQGAQGVVNGGGWGAYAQVPATHRTHKAPLEKAPYANDPRKGAYGGW